MIRNKDNIQFSHLSPVKGLEELVHSYWAHQNLTNKVQKVTILPDSFFKIIIEFRGTNITRYFLTGLWIKEVEIAIPANTSMYGIKFKILAPEYIFNREIASLILSHKDLQLDYWNIRDVTLGNFKEFVEQIEFKLIKNINQKKIQAKKLQLSQLLYLMNGHISAEKVSNQINWSNRQINRYLNKYLGVSLKTYLNIQKCCTSYFQIREGKFFPDDGYYDQAHFIREIKKHTGKTPKELYEKQNDRFIQLKLILKK
jgi:AraC-like DNA-binding protein